MFELLKSSHVKGLCGFAITRDSVRAEVDFGPMSQSERNTATPKEFEHNPKSETAEVRLYVNGQLDKTFEHLSVGEVLSILNDLT